MTYDPFSRGAHPAGARTVLLQDESRDRALPTEVWYPASGTHAGHDLREETQDGYQVMPAAPPVRQAAIRDAEPASGRFPLVLFSHGFGGHRRQTTHFCSHLASHGYVVASVDHTGNTMMDLMQQFLGAQSGGEVPDPRATMATFASDRPLDAIFAIDRVLTGEAGLPADRVDPTRIGITGHSFGGWTTLATTGRDARIRAALPLAPAGGRTPLLGDDPSPLTELDLAWTREVPTLYLVAEHDTLLPLAGMLDLYQRTRAPKQMVVLRESDHMHFCDRVEETHEMFRSMGAMVVEAAFTAGGMPDVGALIEKIRPSSELCPGEHAYTFLRGLGTVHMDAHLKAEADAAKLLEGDVEALLAEKGVAVSVV